LALTTSPTVFPDETPVPPATLSEAPPSAPALAASVSSASTPSHENVPGYSQWPRPFLEGGLSLLQGGYNPAAANAGAGFNLEAKKFLAFACVSADNAHKTTSDTGHDAYFQARVFLRFKGDWSAGAGAQWNELTANTYSKQAWRPALGGGKDFVGDDYSARAQLVYVFSGDDHLNGSHGPEFSLWLPSPALRRHFFYHQTVGIYQSHQTSVPGNSGTNDRFVSLFAGFTLMYRF
jgi:hypothetical protein